MPRLDLKKMISETLLLQPKLWLFAKEVRSLGRNRDAEQLLVPALVRPDTVAVDIGANRGVYTKLMLTRTRNVICVEPNPENARVLERVFGKDVRVISGAASNRNVDVVLRIPDADAGCATIEDDSRSFSGAFKTIRVKAFRIDDLNLENVSFIKIDVEGHELAVLDGALESLKKNQPSILLEAEERHRERAVETVREFLEPLGYEGYMLEKGALVSIRRFDPAVHQSAVAAEQRQSTGRRGDLYINNFIFLPTFSAAQGRRISSRSIAEVPARQNKVRGSAFS
jgi:FkbM family methyltransferase